MTEEIAVSLSPDETYRYLLKYFETRDDIEVKSAKPDSVQIYTSSSRYPWINIRIGMFGEEDKTKLAINFSFRKVYSILTVVTVLVLASVWVVAVNLVEAIVITAIIGVGASISFASEISKAKRKFLDNIRKALDLLSDMKTQNETKTETA